MTAIQNEVTRLYLDQFGGPDDHIGKSEAEATARTICVARLGPIGFNLGIFGHIVQHTVVVTFVTINGDVTIGPSFGDLRSILEYRGISLPDWCLISTECKYWSIDRPGLNSLINRVDREMSALCDHDIDSNDIALVWE